MGRCEWAIRTGEAHDSRQCTKGWRVLNRTALIVLRTFQIREKVRFSDMKKEKEDEGKARKTGRTLSKQLGRPAT